MKIKAVRLREVGLFREAVALEGFSGALDVLAEDNEFGKSTIFRALESVFLKKYSATGKSVDVLKPRAGGTPLVEADFAIGADVWRIQKRFGRSGKAELRQLSGGDVLLRDADAEDRLADLLGIAGGAPAGRFNLLWVAQKHGLAKPAIDFDPVKNKSEPKRGERALLMRAIESEVAAVAGGPLAREVRKRVDAALDVLVTTRGDRKGGPLDEARRTQLALEQQLTEAKERAARIEHDTSELGDLRAREQELKAPGHREALEARVSELRAKLADAEKRAQVVRAAVAERDAARARLVTAERDLATFDASIEKLKQLDARATSDVTQQDCLARELEQASAAVQTAEETQAQLRARDTELKSLLVRRARFDQSQQAAAALEQRVRALKNARSMVDAIAEHRDALRDVALEPEQYDALLALERDISIGEAQLAACAPDVRISYVKGGEGRVSVAGSRVETDQSFKVDAPLTLDIEGVGAISVTPGRSEEAGALGSRLEDLRATLAAQLNALGVADVSAARVLFKEREGQVAAVKDLEAKLAAVAPEGITALEQDVLRLEADVADGETGEAPPEESALQAELETIRADFASWAERLEACRAARQNALSNFEAVKAQAASRAAQREELVHELGEQEARMAKRKLLLQAFEAVRATALDAERACESLPAAPEKEVLEKLTAEVRTAEAELAATNHELGELRENSARLEERIQNADEAGVGVRVAQLEGELTRATGEVVRIDADVAALQLLKRVLDEAEAVAHAQIAAPVMERLVPYLSLLFPDARVTFGEGLQIERLERGGAVDELASLSDGTLEQLAVVARLAYARLLAETGAPTPLFLDDPLAYSDDSRLARVFEAIRLGSTHHQVIVFTCRGRAFESIGGTRLSLTPWTDAP